MQKTVYSPKQAHISLFPPRKWSRRTVGVNQKRARIIFSFLCHLLCLVAVLAPLVCHLLCLVAVLAPLGLYINSKQQHWCTKCIHFKLIFILIPILPNITKLIMTSWLKEKCEMVGRQFGSIVDCNLSFNNCSYISSLLDGASKKGHKMSRLSTVTEYWDKTPRNHKQFTFI